MYIFAIGPEYMSTGNYIDGCLGIIGMSRINHIPIVEPQGSGHGLG
jgi:hypothetical protein